MIDSGAIFNNSSTLKKMLLASYATFKNITTSQEREQLKTLNRVSLNWLQAHIRIRKKKSSGKYAKRI